MNADELLVARWRKSSRSNSNGGDHCVEVAELINAIAVRDSKDRQGPALIFLPTEWAAFVAGVRAGAFERAEEVM